MRLQRTQILSSIRLQVQPSHAGTFMPLASMANTCTEVLRGLEAPCGLDIRELFRCSTYKFSILDTSECEVQHAVEVDTP